MEAPWSRPFPRYLDPSLISLKLTHLSHCYLKAKQRIHILMKSFVVKHHWTVITYQVTFLCYECVMRTAEGVWVPGGVSNPAATWEINGPIRKGREASGLLMT